MALRPPPPIPLILEYLVLISLACLALWVYMAAS